MGDTHDDSTVAVFCNVKFVWNCVFASLEVLHDMPRPHTNVEELLLGGIKLQQRAGTPQDDYEPCRAVVQRRSVASLQTVLHGMGSEQRNSFATRRRSLTRRSGATARRHH